MALYKLDGESLSPFNRLRPGPDLYEEDVEALVWSDLEAFTGEPLFPVARQARIAGGTAVPRTRGRGTAYDRPNSSQPAGSCGRATS